MRRYPPFRLISSGVLTWGRPPTWLHMPPHGSNRFRLFVTAIEHPTCLGFILKTQVAHAASWLRAEPTFGLPQAPGGALKVDFIARHTRIYFAVSNFLSKRETVGRWPFCFTWVTPFTKNSASVLRNQGGLNSQLADTRHGSPLTPGCHLTGFGEKANLSINISRCLGETWFSDWNVSWR